VVIEVHGDGVLHVRPFLAVPLVGTFFIGVMNALVTRFFLAAS
jgi:sodium--glutamate symport carrier gltS